MHPITAETPFHRLWPHSRPRRTPARPAEPPPPPPQDCEHDFLLLNPRPDLCAIAAAPVTSP
ncbi:MAG: hypothetical protein ACO3DQ_04435 [Cephaloticoccus sp.]